MSSWVDVGEDAAGNEVRTNTGPFALVPVWVLEVGLSGSELAVYVSLRSFADGGGGNCFPLTKTIAERAGVAAGTVRNVVSKLRKLGLVETEERRRPDGSTAGLRYTLTNVRPPSSPDDGRLSRADDTPRNEIMTPVTDPSPDQPDQKTSSPPTLFEPEPSKSDAAPSKDDDGLEQVWEWFEKAWEVYGRKGSKKVSRSRWCAAIDVVLKGRREINAKRLDNTPEPYGYGQLFAESAAEWLHDRAKQYAANRPDRTYRKDFERWLSHEIFATPECDPPDRSTVVTSLRYTSDFGQQIDDGRMPWELHEQVSGPGNGAAYDAGVGG